MLPFFQEMENFLENFSVYHSFLYESNGFRAALKDDLTNTREDRLYIYIASHGSGRTIAGCGSAPAIKLTTIFSEIEKITQTTNMRGLFWVPVKWGIIFRISKMSLLGLG